VSILAGCMQDLVRQANKLDRWATYAQIKPNAGKCAVTGILHGTAKTCLGRQTPHGSITCW
jgi:hypothetical protein